MENQVLLSWRSTRPLGKGFAGAAQLTVAIVDTWTSMASQMCPAQAWLPFVVWSQLPKAAPNGYIANRCEHWRGVDKDGIHNMENSEDGETRLRITSGEQKISLSKKDGTGKKCELDQAMR